MRITFARAALFLALTLIASRSSAQDSRRTGDVTFEGLLQTWHLGGTGVDDTFKLRRAELKFSGPVSRRVKWTLMVDPAKALSRDATRRPDDHADLATVLQDAFLTLDYHRRLKVDVGRFKVPLSLEGLESSATLDTERALFSSDRTRGGSYGDVRDVGVMARGSLGGRFGYQLGLFSGTGDTRDELPDDDAKALAARLTYRPVLLSGFQIGGSRVWSGGTAVAQTRRDRLGAELQYERGPLTLKTEYMTGRDGPLEREGYYIHLAYALAPEWEVIGRYDTWDPDTHLETTSGSVRERDYIGGFNYLVGDHMKMQFNFVRKSFTNGIARPAHVAASRFQISW